MFAQNTVPFIETPIFVLNSQYDSWQASYILGTGTSNNELLNEFGANFTKSFNTTMIIDNTNDYSRGGFIDSCFHHCGYWDQIHYDGYTQATSFSLFYSNVTLNKRIPPDAYIWEQMYPFPCDNCCN